MKQKPTFMRIGCCIFDHVMLYYDRSGISRMKLILLGEIERENGFDIWRPFDTPDLIDRDISQEQQMLFLNLLINRIYVVLSYPPASTR